MPPNNKMDDIPPDDKLKQVPQQELALVHEKIDIPDLHPFYKLAYEDAQSGFGERIDMTSFSNRKDLAHDLRSVQEKMSVIRATVLHGTEEERMAIVQSDIFEHMLHKHIKQAHWFGENIESMLPSIFDDIFNGVDLILEESVGRGAFAFSTLAIDATFSAKGAVEKLEYARKLLSKGKLGGIKYFKSINADITGKIDNVPHFVIGVGRPALFKMVGEYVQKGAQPNVNQEARKMVVEQIIVQAKYYAALLESNGFKEEAEKYKRIESSMSDILLQVVTPLSGKDIDEVHKAILEYCAKRG